MTVAVVRSDRDVGRKPDSRPKRSIDLD